ncbi:hypothetical protein ACFLRC_00840 [Candidatus Altiarchaeota archaeon]
MTILYFRRGINKWDRDYSVAFRYEYTADLDKKVRETIFHDDESKRTAALPWTVLRKFLTGENTIPYTNLPGVTLSKVGDSLLLTDAHGLNITIHKDQIQAIRLTAHRIESEVNPEIINLRKKIGV